jgi:hypothetical protein
MAPAIVSTSLPLLSQPKPLLSQASDTGTSPEKQTGAASPNH